MPPQTEPGFGLTFVESSVTGGKAGILWPDVPEDVEFLRQWVASLLKKLNRGAFVTLAFDSERGRGEPLCLQLGEVFIDTYNPFKDSDDPPPIGVQEGVIVFCASKKGTPMYLAISNVLTPLFGHRDITIATFDFTNDLFALETIGIRPNCDHLIDAQLLDAPDTDLLTSRNALSLAETVGRMEFDDPVLSTHRPTQGVLWDSVSF